MKQLFGADGIRGKIDQKPFRTEDLSRLGNSLAQWWLDRTSTPILLIGTDTRESNQRIKAALVGGLTKAGIEIWDAGILPTAALSFLIAQSSELSGGVMISASHNPIFENGIKVFDGQGMKISDVEENMVEELFFSGQTELPHPYNPAKVRSASHLIEQYTQALINEFKHAEWRKNKILVDCANGASYRTVQSVLYGLGLHHAVHNIIPDGTNINFGVGSEYYRKFPLEFAHELRISGADLGVAFDGDADRVVFVDQDGILYDGDMLMAIATFFMRDQHMLKNNRVVITQMSNSGLTEHLKSLGIQTEVVGNGDKYITDILVADDLSLGGEQIGHLIFHTDSRYVTGDGLRTFLWILEALAQNKGVELRDLMQGMKKWPQINVSVMLGERIFSRSEEIPGLAECKARVQDEIKDLSRFECRPASTEPIYRIMLEAKNTPLPVLTQQAMGLARHIQKHFGKQDEPIEILDCVNGGKIDPTSYFPKAVS
jgi:phosphoglucosamine mutase